MGSITGELISGRAYNRDFTVYLSYAREGHPFLSYDIDPVPNMRLCSSVGRADQEF